MGYKTRVSPPGADRGKDIVASTDGLGFEGGRHASDKGLYVSTGGFSKDASYEAKRANIPLTLMDLDTLVKVILDNYERMDTEARQFIALKRIYWPLP